MTKLTGVTADDINARNLAAVTGYMDAWKSYLDTKGIWVIEPATRLYDSIAFSLLNKSFRLGKACITLNKSGFNDEAYGLSRSILEGAINLRYLTLDRNETTSRAWFYANFFYFERLHFLKLSRKYLKDTVMLARIESEAKKLGIETQWPSTKKRHLNDWKEIEDGKWSGFAIANMHHPLDDELNPKCNMLEIYTVFYRAASAMVHCSIRAIDNTFSVSNQSYK